MADSDGGGSGFTGLIAGLLIAVLIVGGGFYLYSHSNQRTAEINVNVPDVQAPGNGS